MNTSEFLTSVLSATPSPVCSMFVQMREHKAPLLVASCIPIEQAPEVLLRFGMLWSKSKNGRSFDPCPANGYERLLRFSDGKLAGSFFVEPVPAVS